MAEAPHSVDEELDWEMNHDEVDENQDVPRSAFDADNSNSNDNDYDREEPAVARSQRPGVQRQNATQALTISEQTYRHLFHPSTFGPHLISLAFSFVALTLTGVGSWDCSYFQGAKIAFTSDHYGLWTMRDSTGKCQLWDVLFFSYNLGSHLMTARVFSMTAMLLGMGLTATMAQASQFHIVSWGIGLALFLVFIVSVSTTSIYNVWSIFWLWTYCVFVLIARCLFIHPVHRRISTRGSRVIAGFFCWCALMTILTLVVLESDFCTCNGISAEKLEDRDVGEPCDGTCKLSSAGYLMIFSSVFWLGAAASTLRYGVQPPKLKENKRRPRDMYANYTNKSIFSRAFGSKSQSQSQSMSMSEEPGSSYAAASKVVKGKAMTQDQQQQQQGGGEPVVFEEEQSAADNENEQQEPEDDLDPEQVLGAPRRNFCQKCCCDYRVVPRSRKEKALFWSFRVGLGFGFFIYILFIAMLISSRVENTNAAKRPSTTPYFTMPQVCAFNATDPEQPFQTFGTKEAADAANWTVAHCGECGKCSNPHDIVRYVETRKTIATKSKQCGVEVYLGSYGSLNRCLQGKIGFTWPCTTCWADNMINTGEKCLGTCVRSLFSGFMTDNNIQGSGDEGWLNQCLFCDEKNSGPAFVTCSGVARRRLGIVSEIERNPAEQCTRVDIDWETVNFTEIGFFEDPSLL